MSVKEFRKLGYLQEVNRKFLHPLGLALEVIIDEETGKEKFGSLWDCREEKIGIKFDDDVIDKQKSQYVLSELRKRKEARVKKLGYCVQPVRRKA